MKKNAIIAFSLFFVLVFSTIIVATPPSGTYPVGTHWCEGNARTGDQEYVMGSNGWEGPYSCPNGCSGYGTNQNCRSKPGGTSGSACAPAKDSSEDLLLFEAPSEFYICV